jgi:hypothetical protein
MRHLNAVGWVYVRVQLPPAWKNQSFCIERLKRSREPQTGSDHRAPMLSTVRAGAQAEAR